MTPDLKNNLPQIEKALRIPWTVWNATLLDEKNSVKNSRLEDVEELAKNVQGGFEMISFFKVRKKLHFSDYQYLMGDFALVPDVNHGFILRMEARKLQ